MNPQPELVTFAEASVADVFIDRGPALPHGAGGPTLCLIAQSEVCAHVYWDAPVDGPGDWELTAWSADDQILQRFQTPDGPTGGFLHVPLAAIARIEATHPQRSEALVLYAPAPPTSSPSPRPRWGVTGARPTSSSPARAWST